MLTFDREDLLFQLFKVANVDEILAADRYAHLDQTTVQGILDAAEQLAVDFFEPIAKKADEEEPTIVNGKVQLIPEAQGAIDAYIESGFMAAGFEQDIDGSDLPETVMQAAFFILATANVAYTGYGLLTTAAGRLLAKFATEEQKKDYLLPMVAGRFFATMCLSEPHAGSSLADIRTTATPNDDGSYAISGNKMWISSGDHELSENIVHLVMAKIPGGPAGVKGISLFIVPKYRLDQDGNPGEANDVALAGLNHKMGYRGITNCAMNFGDNGQCIGYLVGQEHKGLSYMFHMMNEARIFVGVGATALGQAGYQASLNYARERPQGRHPDSKGGDSGQVTIIEHADIRRLLLAQKAVVEPAFALGLYCAKLVDITRSSDDQNKIDEANLLLEMLTPITKSWPSEFCLESNKHALQVLGGAGYTRDYPIERYYRDNRLNPIHEGTHGIQGLDFLGRKSRMLDGKGLQLLITKIKASIDLAKQTDASKEMATQLETALTTFESVSSHLIKQLETDPRAGLANATLYLDLGGHIVMAWMHLRIVIAANAVSNNDDFVKGKWQSARYFFNRELVRSKQWSETLLASESSAYDMQDNWF